MNYQLLKIEKETHPGGDAYIAIVEKLGYEQPFRVTLEHFESAEDAKKQVDLWMQMQTEDDERAEKNKETDHLTASRDKAMKEINNIL